MAESDTTLKEAVLECSQAHTAAPLAASFRAFRSIRWAIEQLFVIWYERRLSSLRAVALQLQDSTLLRR